MLWDVCDESVIGKLVKRQGTSKEISEINDIEKAINSLVEKEIMPLFIATANMVMRTPQGLSISMQPGLKDIEETMVAVMKKNNEQVDKKHDKVISKSEEGNKKIDNLVKRLEVLEQNVLQNNSPETSTSSMRRENFKQRPEGKSNTNGIATGHSSQWQHQEGNRAPRAPTTFIADPSRMFNPVGNMNPNEIKIT